MVLSAADDSDCHDMTSHPMQRFENFSLYIISKKLRNKLNLNNPARSSVIYRVKETKRG